MYYPPVEIKVWGRYACFTRPEAKIERVSYEVPTPSAARGILEAVYWHPPMQWRVREIVVLNPVRHFSILRNEVIPAMSPDRDGIDIIESRAQRHTLGLRDVAYIIRADVWLPTNSHDLQAKHRDQFRRRVEQGRCYHRPYLGCREFAADFSKPDGTEKAQEKLSVDLGLMLFDVFFRSDKKSRQPNQKEAEFYTHTPEERLSRKGYAEAVFKRFRL